MDSNEKIFKVVNSVWRDLEYKVVSRWYEFGEGETEKIVFIYNAIEGRGWKKAVKNASLISIHIDEIVLYVGGNRSKYIYT